MQATPFINAFLFVICMALSSLWCTAQDLPVFPKPKPTIESATKYKLAQPKKIKNTDDTKAVQNSAAMRSPEFFGGLEGWRAFLNKNLNANVPSDNGAPAGNYTVNLTFIVDEYGEISDIKADNNPGYGMVDEAIRVMKLSPRWLPAIMNGKLVKSRYNQKISFSLEEDSETIIGTNIGNIAKDFSQNSNTNEVITLSAFRGKYVLIDFWASWCNPCRTENPNIVKLYNNFRQKGLVIIGVSLDRNKNDWLNAIQTDRLQWLHCSDLNYWNNKVALDYNINSIPANVIIDPSGKIVAKNLRGEVLYKKIEVLLK